MDPAPENTRSNPGNDPMKELESIVVGVDLVPDGSDVTDGSRRAAKQALWLAGQVGAKVTLFHSTARDEYWDPLGKHYVVVGEGPPVEGSEAMERLVEAFRGADVPCTLVQKYARPAIGLIAEAMRVNADLIVVGKRAKEERDGHRLGRISKKVLRKSPRPVWVVKPDHDRVAKSIVAATDLTPVSDKILAYAHWLAEAMDAELHVLHACPFEFLPSAQFQQPNFTERNYDHGNRIEATRGAIEEHLKRIGAHERAKIHVVSQPADLAIRSLVEEVKADLLVMGAVSRTGIAGLLVGNTAEMVLEKVDCSILAVKPEGFVTPVELKSAS